MNAKPFTLLKFPVKKVQRAARPKAVSLDRYDGRPMSKISLIRCKSPAAAATLEAMIDGVYRVFFPRGGEQ